MKDYICMFFKEVMQGMPHVWNKLSPCILFILKILAALFLPYSPFIAANYLPGNWKWVAPFYGFLVATFFTRFVILYEMKLELNDPRLNEKLAKASAWSAVCGLLCVILTILFIKVCL